MIPDQRFILTSVHDATLHCNLGWVMVPCFILTRVINYVELRHGLRSALNIDPEQDSKLNVELWPKVLPRLQFNVEFWPESYFNFELWPGSYFNVKFDETTYLLTVDAWIMKVSKYNSVLNIELLKKIKINQKSIEYWQRVEIQLRGGVHLIYLASVTVTLLWQTKALLNA